MMQISYAMFEPKNLRYDDLYYVAKFLYGVK